MSTLLADTLKTRVSGAAVTFTKGVNVAGVGTFATNVVVVGALDVDGATTLDAVTIGETLAISDSTESTSSTTGALTITGGVGIAKSLNVGGNVTVGGTLTYEDVTNVDSLGLATYRSGLLVGSPTAIGATIGVDNSGDAIFAGIVTAGTCFKAGSVSGGAFGAGVGVTITGDGNAVFSGITTVTNFDAKGTLVEAFSSTTTAYNSNGNLNISNGNVQFSSANLGGTGSTLNIISSTGINTDLADGQTLTVTAISAVNATTAFVNKITVDGKATGITTHWVGGSVPSAGGGSGVDLYTFNLLKTGSATYIIVANQTLTSS